jgi:hypothetical protein
MPILQRVPRLRIRFGGIVAFAIACSAALVPSTARAADAQQETADGIQACRDFAERNEKELKVYEAAQPPVPYKYSRPDTLLDAPWMPFMSWFAGNLDLMAATFIPALGAQIRGDTPATMITWPLTFPVGPAYACSRKSGTFVVNGHRAHRIMLEPGIVLADQGIGIMVRPGYRFIYHPSEWVVGVGGGLGSTLEVAGNKEPFRASIGPEAVLHFGHCCDRSYFTLALRYDYFYEGRESNVLGASLGYVYF